MYAAKDDIKDILGLSDTSSIRDSFLKIANIYIDIVLVNGDFLEHSDEIEVFDVEKDTQDTILLKYPILKVTRVKDNVTSDTPITLLAANFDFDAESGILFLKQNTDETTITEQLTYFTKGRQNVEVIYDYGYEETPDDVHTFANEFAAKVCKSDIELAEVGSMVSEKIGDYSYQVNIGKNILARYEYLQPLAEAISKKYKKVFV